MRPRVLSLLLVVPLLAVGGTAGCSSDDDSTCADLQALASEVDGLLDLNPLEVGTDGVSDQLDDVQSAWETAEDTAGSQFGSELDGVESSVDALVDTLGSLGDGDLADDIDQVDAELDDVRTAFDALSSAVDSELGDCPLDGEEPG